MPITVYPICGICGKKTQSEGKRTFLRMFTAFGQVDNKLQAYHQKCLKDEGIET